MNIDRQAYLWITDDNGIKAIITFNVHIAMGLIKLFANISNKLIRTVGTVVAKSVDILTNGIGFGQNYILERGNAVLERGNEVQTNEMNQESSRLSTIQTFMDMGLDYDVSAGISSKVMNAIANSKGITEGATIQIETLTYGDDFRLAKDEANYLPITAYSFKNDILEKLDKYNYVLPLLIITEIKNTSSNTGLRLDCAVTTAYNNTWLKADSDVIMSNLQPLSIDNKEGATDIQPISQETYKTYTIEELQNKFKWLKNNLNLDILFQNRFTDSEGNVDTTKTRDPNNGITIKETERKDSEWISYDVFNTMLNGVQNRTDLSDKTILFTGYAIKPRDDLRGNIPDDELKDLDNDEKCSVSVRSTMLVLGLQNEQDSNKKMLTNPKSITVLVPGLNGSSPIEITNEEVQEYAAKKYLTRSNMPTNPTVIMNMSDMVTYNIWEKEALEYAKHDDNKHEKLRKLIERGLYFNSPSKNDSGFHIRE